MDCLPSAELDALLRGAATPEAEASAARHLADCESCRAALEALAGGSSWLQTTRTASGTPTQSPSLANAIQQLESATIPPTSTDGAEPVDFLSPSNEPGTLGRLGTYRILERIASGGMGIVFKAQDPGLNRVVAIKVLAPSLARNSLARARFIREARAAAAVVHEHVVGIHAVEEFNGLPCIVMQFIKGRTLAERLRASGPMRLEEILRIGAQAAAGLAAAHAQGLVHRDIKPGNILLENGVERVKLTDFGLARAVDDTELTRAGQMAGTPEYMAPEQATAGNVDQRADLFSLGCVLYAMAVGKSPFAGGSTIAVLRRVCDESPQPLHEVAPQLPEWFNKIVLRLLEKKPALRYGSAAELQTELESRLSQCQKGLDAAPRLARSWGLVAASVLAVAVLALVFNSRPKRAQLGAGYTAGAFSLLLNDGSQRSFTNLSDAVASAPGGATIEIATSGYIPTPPLQIRGKALRLRAAHGTRPVLYQPNPLATLLETDSPLVLEGLALERAPGAVPLPLRVNRNPPALARHENAMPQGERDRRGRGERQTMPPLVEVRGATLLATHCRFAVRDADSVMPEESAACVKSMDAVRVVLQHSELQALHALGIDWQGGQTKAPNDLVLSNLVFLGRGFVRVGVSGTLSVNDCTIAAQCLMTPQIFTGPEGPAGSVRFNHNAVEASSLLSFPPAIRTGVNAKPNWTWVGTSNLYEVQVGYTQSRLPRNDTVPRLADWRAYWPTEERGTIEARIEFPQLPLTANSLTNFTARQLEVRTAQPIADLATPFPGARIAEVGPAAFDAARRHHSFVAWEKAVAALLAGRQ